MRCPACGQDALFINHANRLICAHKDCPDPDEASRTLEKPAKVLVEPRELPSAPPAQFETGHFPRFHQNQIVHHRDGSRYRIDQTPLPYKRLEHCNEPYYTYTTIAYATVGNPDATQWIRCQSEMEDGRFTPAQDEATSGAL